MHLECLTRAKFKYQLAIAIDRYGLEQDGKRGWLLRRAHGKTLRGILVLVREVVWGEFFVYFVNILRYYGKGGRIEGMHRVMSCYSTLSALSYDWWYGYHR